MADRINKTKLKEILLVDDDADYRELTRMRLEAAGYQVSFASGGRQALELLKGGCRPDLLILDINMPDKNGLATMVNLNAFIKRESDQGARIPVIVATGLQSEKVQEILMAQQVDDYLRKPYEAEELI